MPFKADTVVDVPSSNGQFLPNQAERCDEPAFKVSAFEYFIWNQSRIQRLELMVINFIKRFCDKYLVKNSLHHIIYNLDYRPFQFFFLVHIY